MGLGYWRLAAVATTVGLLLSLAGGGVAMAADDVVMDGVVTVHWVDPDDGPIAGATIRITWYREGDVTHGNLPAVTTDVAGDAVVSGAPRPAVDAARLLLDIRGDRATATVDEMGCTVNESWLAHAKDIVSGADVEVVLDTESKGIDVQCPEPTPTTEPTTEPTPPGTTPPASSDPSPTATSTPTASPSGGVLGATGTPGVTPPSTNTVASQRAPGGSPFVPILLALIGLTVLIAPAMTLALAHARGPHRRR